MTTSKGKGTIHGEVVRITPLPKVALLTLSGDAGVIDVAVFARSTPEMHSAASSWKPGDVVRGSGYWKDRDGKAPEFILQALTEDEDVYDDPNKVGLLES